MNVSMYPCHADPDAPKWEQPTSDVSVDDDGEVVLRFEERGSYLSVTMRPDQFMAFISKADDVRNSILLAQIAAERQS